MERSSDRSLRAPPVAISVWLLGPNKALDSVVGPWHGGNMLKVRQVAVWFAIVGIALAAQGCWDNDEDRLTLLGDGGCRTADGSEGNHTVISQESQEACKARCFVGDEPCTAVEFNANNGNCEVHSRPITKIEALEGVTCHVLR